MWCKVLLYSPPPEQSVCQRNSVAYSGNTLSVVDHSSVSSVVIGMDLWGI